MKNVAELHRNAMEFADLAAEAKRSGDHITFVDLTQKAFKSEYEAAQLLATDYDFEPTRSVLHRSAASLALECGETRLAEKLISTALSGNPPDEIAEELRDLLENVYFQRHLELRGVSLQPNEFQMSLEGQAVGFGIARSDYFVGRVKDLETLIYRTAERKRGRDFRDAGRRKKNLSEELELYVSVPRAASFAVTFKLGKSNQLNLPGIDFSSEVVDDLLDCIELLNQGEMEKLHDRIQDETYFRNFVGLAQKIAPDGGEVRTVGFTTSSDNGGRKVAFTRPKKNIQEKAATAVIGNEIAVGSINVQIRGILLEADATKQREGRIEIVDSENVQHKVRVPRGMMADIVKPYFEETVVVTGHRQGEFIILQSIDLAEDEIST